MKIKKCCKDMEKNIPYPINCYDMLKGIKGNYYVSMWISDDDSVIINYCPFCGKKIEVEECA